MIQVVKARGEKALPKGRQTRPDPEPTCCVTPGKFVTPDLNLVLCKKVTTCLVSHREG